MPAAWIALTAKCDISEHSVSRARATMKQWPDDEELLGIFIVQMYSGLPRDELTPHSQTLRDGVTGEVMSRSPYRQRHLDERGIGPRRNPRRRYDHQPRIHRRDVPPGRG